MVVEFLPFEVGPALQAHHQDVHRAHGRAAADRGPVGERADLADRLVGVARHKQHDDREQAAHAVPDFADDNARDTRREHGSFLPELEHSGGQYTQGMPYLALAPTVTTPPDAPLLAADDAAAVGVELPPPGELVPSTTRRARTVPRAPRSRSCRAAPPRAPAGQRRERAGSGAELGRDLGRVGRRARAVEHLCAGRRGLRLGRCVADGPGLVAERDERLGDAAGQPAACSRRCRRRP